MHGTHGLSRKQSRTSFHLAGGCVVWRHPSSVYGCHLWGEKKKHRFWHLLKVTDIICNVGSEHGKGSIIIKSEECNERGENGNVSVV